MSTNDCIPTLDISSLERAVDLACEELDRLRTINARLRAINADLLAALKNWQNYEKPLEERQNAAMAAIARAEGR
jgi:hypothetical protein